MPDSNEMEIEPVEKKPARAKRRRIELLDELRGLAVFCMIFYHGFFLVGDVFHYAPGGWLMNFFMPAEPFFAGLFIIISGISSRLSHSNMARGLKLLAVAMAFTVITVAVLPHFGITEMGIYFGILHFLSISMLIFALIRPFLNNINPVWGVLICIALYILTANTGNGYWGIAPDFKLLIPAKLYDVPYLFPLGIHTKAFTSADYFPLFPQIFIFLSGTFFGVYVKAGRVPEWAYKKRVAFCGWLGRHALLIYILHLPVIYFIIFIVKFMVAKL